MCGRFNIIDDPMTQLLMEITGMTSDWHIDTSLNIAPTQTVPVLRYDDHWSITPMRWWLVPYWSPAPSTKYSMFNAKSETLATSRGCCPGTYFTVCTGDMVYSFSDINGFVVGSTRHSS